MTKTFTIGKTERLKSRKLIDQLFTSGRKFNAGPYRVSYAVTIGPGPLKVGVGAGTRHFKRAHDRNRIKRLTRETWRPANADLKAQLIAQNRSLGVFILYTGKELPEYALVCQQMDRIIDNLLRFSDEKNTPLP